MPKNPYEIPVGHLDDPDSVSEVIAALRALHGEEYGVEVGRWQGRDRLSPERGKTVFRFVVRSLDASVLLAEGSLVRGPSPDGPYRPLDGDYAKLTSESREAVWPGDVLTVDERMGGSLELEGHGVYFDVATPQTGYRAPRLAMLRNLPDKPGGCAKYAGAFRRETIPPQKPTEGAGDKRGANRVNEHTLDMRPDREPPPTLHHHGPVECEAGKLINHTETALVLPRAAYGLPLVNGTEDGQAWIYRRPTEDPTDRFKVPVRPGSIVVTPSTAERAYGHCFENAFAMLVAVPGFVAPYVLVK